jgi:hypothetical protein
MRGLTAVLGLLVMVPLIVGLVQSNPDPRRGPTPLAAGGPPTSQAILLGVDSLESDDAWAVGMSLSGPGAGLILHWDGKAWSRSFRSAGTGGGSEELVSVSGTRGSRAWAVGDATGKSGKQSASVIERWIGDRWSRSRLPACASSYSSYLTSVAAARSGQAWAVGSYDPTGRGDSYPLVLHWAEGVWSCVAVPHPHLPNETSLASIAIESPRDLWAVGSVAAADSQTSTVYILHWDGSSWTRSRAPKPGDLNSLSSVSVSHDGSAWAVGEKVTQGASQPLVLGLGSPGWKQIPLPQSARTMTLRSVSDVSANDAWIVGKDNSAASRAVTLHWDGHAWSVVACPDPGEFTSFFGVSASNSQLAWAVGATSSGSTENALVEQWNGRQWRVK